MRCLHFFTFKSVITLSWGTKREPSTLTIPEAEILIVSGPDGAIKQEETSVLKANISDHSPDLQLFMALTLQ